MLPLHEFNVYIQKSDFHVEQRHSFEIRSVPKSCIRSFNKEYDLAAELEALTSSLTEHEKRMLRKHAGAETNFLQQFAFFQNMTTLSSSFAVDETVGYLDKDMNLSVGEVVAVHVQWKKISSRKSYEPATSWRRTENSKRTS